METNILQTLVKSKCPLSYLLEVVGFKRRDLTVKSLICTVDGITMKVRDRNLGRVAIVQVSAKDADGILKDFFRHKEDLKGIKDENKYYVYFWQWASEFEQEELAEEILDVMVFREKNPIVEQLSYQEAFA